jgi:hypothetical protein
VRRGLGGSYWFGYLASVHYRGKSIQGWFGLVHQRIELGYWAIERPFAAGWRFYPRIDTSWSGWSYRDAHSTWHFMGFTYDDRIVGRGATIPLWFPTLLSALLLWFVWRKTRATPVGRAFPVEVAKSGENPTRPTHEDPSAAS